jgi:predicted TIM-barrel fold metal-dependent hydrolase
MATTTPEAIDVQIHVFAPHEPEHPWSPTVLHSDFYAGMRGRYAGRSARPREVLAALDEHGVAGAVIVTPAVYGFDNSYSLETYDLAPERIRVIGLVDMTAPDVEETIREWASNPAAIGIRLNLWADEAVARFLDGGDDRALTAAADAGLCVCVNSPGRFPVFERIAERFPSLQLVVDHLGLFDVAMLDRAMPDTWNGIDGLLGLANHPNVAVKVTSVPLISREPYPYPDAWPHIHAVIEAFGVERLMWGTDAFIFDHPYGESIDFIRASDELDAREKEMLLGGALRRVMRWSAPI